METLSEISMKTDNQVPMVITAVRGLCLTKMETVVGLGVSVSAFVIGKWEIAILCLATLALFRFLEQYGAKPMLVLRKQGIEYRVGKVVATAVWSEISNVIVKGNVLVGRSLLVEGKVSVVNGSNRAVKRPSIQISDVFSEEIEQVRELLLAFLQDNNETVSQSLNISRNNRM